MPIVNGSYVAPSWTNGSSPAINAAELQAISDTLEKLSSGGGWTTVEIIPLNISTYTANAGTGSAQYTTVALPSEIDLMGKDYEMELVVFGAQPVGGTISSTMFQAYLVDGSNARTILTGMSAVGTETPDGTTGYTSNISSILHPQTTLARTGATATAGQKGLVLEQRGGYVNGVNRLPEAAQVGASIAETNFTSVAVQTAPSSSSLTWQTYGVFFRYRPVG